ncbi:hypothetical protein [uncultured Paracoccus sp.]|uniref:hypothetical protein n=1 Tax=uncultured Paracoccus sp. TaxID=189685 RepID=UPI002638E03B|nr:hypothetical protein [uncultured Paracoccus sp.]
MAEERPNMLVRAMDAVQSIIRPDYTQNREVQRAATLAEATARRELIDAARAEAMDTLSRLGEIPAAQREQEMRNEGIDPTVTSDWDSADWTDRTKLEAKVEADVQARAESNKLDLNVHEERLAAYAGVSEAYDEAHVAVNFNDWVKTSAIPLSEHPIFGDGEQQAPEDPEADLLRRQQEAVAAGREAEARGERVLYVHGRPYVDPGNDAVHSEGEDREAGVTDARASRITTAFSDMADAVAAGERPEFRSAKMAEAFWSDLEARYGDGIIERLRAGDSSDLAQDVTDRNRLQLVGAAVRMVAESHAVLRDHVQEPVQVQTNVLDRDSGPDLDL